MKILISAAEEEKETSFLVLSRERKWRMATVIMTKNQLYREPLIDDAVQSFWFFISGDPSHPLFEEALA